MEELLDNIRLRRTTDGVVHWVYAMQGTLLVCGYAGWIEPGLTGREQPEFPTCLTCISMVDRDRHIVEPTP